MIKVEIERVNGAFGFEARDGNGHTLTMDTSQETGGENFGFRPMQLLLMGLGGCSGIDVLSILKKQRQHVDKFSIKIDGAREQGVEPSLWKNVNLVFQISGEVDADKAQKACALSIDKYCSVAETLKKSGTSISWTVEINPPAGN